MRRSFFYFLFILVLTKASAQKISGEVARYLFENSLKDEVGGHDAKAYGGNFTDDRFGNSKSAYYLTGNYTDYINLGTSRDLKTKNGTISLWVNIYQPVFSGYGADHNPIIYTRAHNGEDCNEAFFMGYHMTLREFNVCTALSELKQVVVYQEGTAYLRQWYHMAITFDDHYLSFYLDGVLQNRTPKNFESKFLEGDSIMVGNRTSKRNNRYMQGCVDDIRFFNRVLSPSEILELYNAPNPNTWRVIANWTLVGLGVLGIILFIIWMIRRRIENLLAIEKEKNQLRNHWYEQENRVLTAQMDPHFIFNSLNTIQQFIITNDNDKAQEYLSKFSKLIRKLIESNTKESITLQEEIEIFEKYIEIESLRFNNVFNFKITLQKDIDPALILIPHFLIQPIIENAIWHGLLPKDGTKELTVYFERIDENRLSCTVEDNGIGRKNAAKPAGNSERKSLAVNFIEQRLQLMSKMRKVRYGITIVDKEDEEGKSTGTKVIITIPIL